MKVVDVAEFVCLFDEYLAAVADGEEVEIRRGSVPLALVVPVRARHRNRTVLGCGAGTVVVKADLADPMIPMGDWEMVRNDPT